MKAVRMNLYAEITIRTKYFVEDFVEECVKNFVEKIVEEFVVVFCTASPASAASSASPASPVERRRTQADGQAVRGACQGVLQDGGGGRRTFRGACQGILQDEGGRRRTVRAAGGRSG